MPGPRNLEPLSRNCSNCRYAKCVIAPTGVRIEICDNNNSKEFKNQVDRYLHCPFYKRKNRQLV